MFGDETKCISLSSSLLFKPASTCKTSSSGLVEGIGGSSLSVYLTIFSFLMTSHMYVRTRMKSARVYRRADVGAEVDAVND